MELREEYIKEFREQQQRYVYYLLAISIASIGFCVNLTMDRSLVAIDIVLGSSILCWLVSSLYGINAVKTLVIALANNVSVIDISSGKHELTGTHPEKIVVGLQTMDEVAKTMSNRSLKYMNIQRRGLYWGIVLFVVWRVLDMLPEKSLKDLLTLIPGVN